jgi:hypothetical protein
MQDLRRTSLGTMRESKFAFEDLRCPKCGSWRAEDRFVERADGDHYGACRCSCGFTWEVRPQRIPPGIHAGIHEETESRQPPKVLTAMEAPKCKICQERHWGLCTTSDTASSPAPIAGTSSPQPPAIPKISSPPSPSLPIVPPVGSPAAPSGKFDPVAWKRAYQREYMRKWRASRRK